jgi:hypothetical protein
MLVETSGQQEMMMRYRSDAIIAVAYLGAVLAGTEWSAFDGSFSPDTAGYLDFSPYRQPMYGLWANTIFALTGSFRAVQFVQIALFTAVGIWVVIELSLISDVAAAIFAVALAGLNRFGLTGLAGSLNSEGLFYPMILVMVALFLWWLRSRRTGILAALALLLVAMTQLRTAAMLLPMLPLVIVAYMLITRSRRQGSNPSAIAIIGGLVAGAVVLPPMLGKNFLQYSTIADSTGFALLPRVSLLPVPQTVAARSPDWAASSWRKAAAPLNAVALTQFDAQVQEAIRFDLGPKVLLPAVLNLSPDKTTVGWQDGTYYPDARRIAVEWIGREWPTYVRISAYHLWGMLTIANFMDTADRINVWAALHEVSPSTWGDKPMRKDYPLNQIDKPLKWSTELIYRAIRYGCIMILFLGLISAIIVLLQGFHGRTAYPGKVAVALAVSWCVLHSIPAGMLVFPEFRYTYANLLVLMSGAATWLGYLIGRLAL